MLKGTFTKEKVQMEKNLFKDRTAKIAESIVESLEKSEEIKQN